MRKPNLSNTPQQRKKSSHSHSFTDYEMTNLGYYNSSSSSSSNLSPLAQPFTVIRSNPNPNTNTSNNFGNNWLPSNPNPNPSSSCNNVATSNNWSSMNSSITSGLDGISKFGDDSYGVKCNGQLPPWTFGDDEVSFKFDMLPAKMFREYGTSSKDEYRGNVFESTYSGHMDGSRGKESLFGGVFGDRAASNNTFESTYSGQADGSRGKGSSPMFGDRVASKNNIGQPSSVGNLYDAFPETNYGLVSNGFSKENSNTWNKRTVPFETKPLLYDSACDLKSLSLTDASRGKDDSAIFQGLFGDPVARENNIGPSVVGKSHDKFPATNYGLVSSGISKEHNYPWNGNTSYYDARPIFDDSSINLKSPLITKPSPSIVIKPSVTVSPFTAQSAVSTKSMEIGSTSLFNSTNALSSHKPFKKEESCRPVGFEFKASSSDNSKSEDVKSAVNSSELLDHHHPGEDSPCWKGAPTHFSPFGSLEAESSQHPIKKLQKEDSVNVQSHDGAVDRKMHDGIKDAANLVTSESLDVNTVVKALSNLSELLLRDCAKDECGLKEHDQQAIAHVISNLNTCMSKMIQQVDAAHPDQESNIEHSGKKPDQEKNNEYVGKNIEELHSDSVRDNDLPKDYNIIQKIKKVLDENLECNEDQPSDSLLYKNLWLEAEAELCTSSFRARFDRAKKDIDKPKASVQDVPEAASDKKKLASSIFSPIADELTHEAAGTKTSNTHAHNPSLHNVDDVENSVMARFNILKRREESNPVSMAEKEPADIEAFNNEIRGFGVAEEPHLGHHVGKDDAVIKHSYSNQKIQPSIALGTGDIEHSVMARLNVLKSRGEPDPDAEYHGLADDAYFESSDKGSESCGLMGGPYFQHQADKVMGMASGSDGGTKLMQNWFDPGSYTTYGASSDWEYVLKR